LNQIDLARAMTDKLKNTTNNALELISAIDDYCSMNFDKSKSILSQLIFNDNEPYKDFYNAAIAYCLGMMYVDSNKNESLSNFERAKNLSPDTEIFKLSENMLRLIRESGDGNG
jgi:spore coat polysaccharide biosynthesis predicted glycosyltransferase SpsG